MLPSHSNHKALIIHNMTQKQPISASWSANFHESSRFMLLPQIYGIAGNSCATIQNASLCKCDFILHNVVWNSSSVCLQFYIVNYLSKHQKEKIIVPIYSMSMFTMHCHSVTKTARWFQMCEKALQHTAIWMSSSVRSKAVTHLHGYTVYVHAVLYIIESAQQSVCQLSVSRSWCGFPTSERNWGCVLSSSTVMLLFHKTLFLNTLFNTGLLNSSVSLYTCSLKVV